MPVITVRSNDLMPLSKEHEDGLQFAERLRAGIANQVSTTLLKEYTFWFWKNHIRPHFRQEEDVLLSYFPPGNKLAQRMRNEHDMIRELILCLDEEADNRTLTLFADLIQDHILFEETEMFEWLEKELTPPQLHKISQELERHPVKPQKEWDDRFWDRKR